MTKIEIHDFAGRLERTKQHLLAAPIPEVNKQAILQFDRFCVLSGLSVVRREKLMRHVREIACDLLGKPFDTVTKDDLKDVVAAIEATDLAAWTKHDVKSVLKKFFTWFLLRDAAADRGPVPDLVSWIRPAVKKRDKIRVKAADLLTAEEVERMIGAARTSRDKAFIALLYELGARIGEVGSMHVGDISRDDYSLLADVDGKTGKRNVRVVQYASYVVAWLNVHPLRDSPDAPLWPNLRPRRYLAPLRYDDLWHLVAWTRDAAHVSKRVFPHLFRYSRATHVLASGKLNEAQAKVYFGWVPDSGMLSTYVHLVAKDANDAVLRMYGIKRDDAEVNTTRACGMCRAPNPTSALFCFRCGYALSAIAGDDLKKRVVASEETLARLLRRADVQTALMQALEEEQRSENGSSQLDGRSLPTEEPRRELVRRKAA